MTGRRHVDETARIFTTPTDARMEGYISGGFGEGVLCDALRDCQA